MNIYLRELKAYRKSIFIWSISMVVFIVMGMSEQSAFAESGSTVTEFLNSMPKSLQALMGGGAFDPTTKIGYFSMINSYLVLMTTIHAAMIGAGIIGKEERDKTVEFLMAKPVSRHKVIGFKWLAAFTNVLMFNFVTLFTTLVIIGSNGVDVIKLTIGMFLLQILFLSIGSVLAAYKNKAATGIATGILLISFFTSIVLDMFEKVTFINYLTPFKYFDAKTLLIEEGFSIGLVGFTIALTALLTYLTFLFYDNRDLGH